VIVVGVCRVEPYDERTHSSGIKQGPKVVTVVASTWGEKTTFNPVCASWAVERTVLENALWLTDGPFRTGSD